MSTSSSISTLVCSCLTMFTATRACADSCGTAVAPRITAVSDAVRLSRRILTMLSGLALTSRM